jgi:hypothetical protein
LNWPAEGAQNDGSLGYVTLFAVQSIKIDSDFYSGRPEAIA